MRAIALVVLLLAVIAPSSSLAASSEADAASGAVVDRAEREATTTARSELAQRTAAIRSGKVSSTSSASAPHLQRQWSHAVDDADRFHASSYFGLREAALLLGIIALTIELRSRRIRRKRSSR